MVLGCNGDKHKDQKNIKPANIEPKDKTVSTYYYGEKKPCKDYDDELFCKQSNVLNAGKSKVIKDENNNTIIINKDSNNSKDN